MDDDNGGKKPQKSKLPLIALWLDLGAVGTFYLGLAAFVTAVFAPVALFLWLATAILPVAGVTTGICALCIHKDLSKSGKIIAAIAIAAPVIFVIVMIILFSTGVAYIRFM